MPVDLLPDEDVLRQQGQQVEDWLGGRRQQRAVEARRDGRRDPRAQGLRIDPEERRANGLMRLFTARPS